MKLEKHRSGKRFRTYIRVRGKTREKPKYLKIVNIIELCPEIGSSSVEISLIELCNKGVIERHGVGCATFYTRIN